VANLLLARATTRRKEFSIRMVMGGGRGRLVRQLLAESLVLAVMGVLTGVPLAMWMSQSLGYLMPRGANVPVSFDIRLSADVLWFNLLICVAGCVAAGIIPALNGARTNLNEVLKEGGRSGHEGTRSARLRGALVVIEVAMAMIAIIGAGLFARSFQLARRMNPGFDPRNVLVAHVDLSAVSYGAPERRQLCERLGQRVASQPGIVGVSWADVIPLWFTGNPLESVQVEGYVPGLSESMKIFRNVVAPGYFELLRIPLIEGRDFTGHDDESAKRVMIVNQTFANRFFSGREALGRRVQTMGEWYTIVGVARDSKYVKPTENAQPYFYVPMRQVFGGLMIAIHIRTASEPESAAPILRREMAAIDPAVRVFDFMPMTEAISAGVFGQKMAAALLGGLGVFALALAATGLYSVMAYAVAQRTQEIGIRMALGAQRADVLALVVRRGMGLTFVGLFIGVAAALGVMRLAASQLVQVSAADPLVFLGASLFLAIVALAANYFPARRTTRIDPNTALHCE
jgi:predicted permease